MSNIENADKSDALSVEPHTPQPTGVPGAGIDLPAQQTPPQPRNQHLRVPEPKSKTLGGRCTETEFALISKAMAANGCTDIVRLMLLSIDLHRKDFLTPFKTG